MYCKLNEHISITYILITRCTGSKLEYLNWTQYCFKQLFITNSSFSNHYFRFIIWLLLQWIYFKKYFSLDSPRYFCFTLWRKISSQLLLLQIRDRYNQVGLHLDIYNYKQVYHVCNTIKLMKLLSFFLNFLQKINHKLFIKYLN